MRSEIDSRVCRAECDYNSYVSVRRYKQRKIATELHRPKWVSLPLVDATLRDDVLISFITPPEFQTELFFTIERRIGRCALYGRNKLAIYQIFTIFGIIMMHLLQHRIT